MLKATVDSGESTQDGSPSPAAITSRPASASNILLGFAFLTAESRQRYRIDEIIREIGRRGRFSPRLTTIAWGISGFLIGAIFWHSVGIWGALSAAVLKTPDVAVSVVERPAEVVAGVPNCTVLALNRSTGRTTSVPCPDPMPAFDEASSKRQDFAAVDLR